jgi:hypothetical protein
MYEYKVFQVLHPVDPKESEILIVVVMKTIIFWGITSCSSSTLKMEAICSSETLVDFQRTTRRYILEESNIQILKGSDNDI